MDSQTTTRSGRRSGGLAALLPGLLVLAVVTAGSAGSAGSGPDGASGTAATERAPVVDLTVRSGHR